jgi:transcriptional regulator with XRE-family HTH domain
MPAKIPPKPASSFRQAFARRLEAARIAAGYSSMREFAAALGIQEARYRRWEAAETEPDLAFLQKIAKATGASLDSLISGEPRATL